MVYMISEILDNLGTKEIAPAFDEDRTRGLKPFLDELTGCDVYPRSITAVDHSIIFLYKEKERRMVGKIDRDATRDFEPGFPAAALIDLGGKKMRFATSEFNAAVASFLRQKLEFLRPRTLGLKKSAGCGDRLGSATAGHVRAIRRSSMRPIFAQQSIRENSRTGRSPQNVMDDALWGVLQEGWREGFGADADHLKNTQDIDSCAEAGFTFFTIDPGDFVDSDADQSDRSTLGEKLEMLPWAELETTWTDVRERLNRQIDLGNRKISLDEEDLLRAAVKYGKVVAHTRRMVHHLEKVMNARPFELEMSVDETDTVTSLADHLYLANELKRLGVKWVSLAPRYVGTFEKGVDYIGDLIEFERSFSDHLDVALAFGPYKLSLHSGSDKFSIYPIAARLGGDLVHLKTAGTSYLEALRTIVCAEPELFREILSFACERYPADRATYHVSAEIEKMPDPGNLRDQDLTGLLDDFHAREILHVTYGSVLQHRDLGPRLTRALDDNDEMYNQFLEAHFTRHFKPFTAARAGGEFQ